MRKILFSPPDITEAEIQEVTDALRSGWITTGPRTKELEKLIAKYIGTEMCVCLNSQTACAEMALRILGVEPGDEVITSAYTYTASASIIDHLGATIVLVDTQKDSFEMDYEAVEAAITEKTKAIIPVDLGGVICNYDRLFEIVERQKNYSMQMVIFKKHLAELRLWLTQPTLLGQAAMAEWQVPLLIFRVFLSTL